MSTTAAPTGLDQIVSLLQKVPFLEGLPQSDIERLVRLLRGRTLQPGELLYREGDPADKFYIVHSGAVEILKERPRGDHQRLSVKHAGEAFGELGLVIDSHQGTTARAIEPARLLVLGRAQFETLLGGDSMPLRMLRSLARAQRSSARFSSYQSGSDSADALRTFNRQLQEGLLPRVLPIVDGYDVAAGIAQDIDGNHQALWCTTPLQSGGALFAVMDVKGAALPPAHLLAIAHGLLSEIAPRESAASAIMGRLNEAVARNLYEGLDACIEAGVLVLNHDRVSLALAGDDPAVVIRNSGAVEEIMHSGPALGIVPRFEYASHDFTLAFGDCVLLFSESDSGLIRGAADLLKKRREQSAAQVAGALQAALVRAQAYRKGNDLAFILVKRL